MIEAVTTPEARFAGLPDYPFASNWIEGFPGYGALRMHYLDEGPRDAGVTFLCLHGQPTWSYLYRRMIPVFAAAGHRVVAPDLFGFGKSDKPVDDGVYSFAFHRAALIHLIGKLDLSNVCLVCQDWGGLLGLTLPMDMAERFTRVLAMNTGLGTGDVPLGEGFTQWRAWVAANPDFDIAGLMKRACPHLSDEEVAAYAAPYPDAVYRAGVRRFPAIVPERPDDDGAPVSRRAREWWRSEWLGESFMAIGMQDPVLGPPVMRNLRKMIRNCPEPMEVEEAGHFVQEWGAPVARAALEAFGIA